MTIAADATEAVLRLLGSRAPGATVCPSEVARSLFGVDAAGPPDGWRAMMPVVNAAVDQLVTERRLRLSWKGRSLPSRAGPYRIGRGELGCP